MPASDEPPAELPSQLGSSGVEQKAEASDHAQQAVQGWGAQYNYFLHAASVKTLPSISPPLGRCDPQAPLRGRDAVVAQLTATVTSDGTGPRVHVLCGLGGCGKTRLALEIAHRAIQRDTEVWWVSAVDAGVLVGGMQAVTYQLGASAEQLAQANPADLLWRLLRQRTARWLLVIDNADDPQPVLAPGGRVAEETGWLRPPGPKGAILVTTRDGQAQTWGPQAKLHPVRVLDDKDGGQILMDLAGPEAGSMDEAAALARRLGGLPLALELAGSYLAEVTAMPASLRGSGSVASYTDYRAALERDFIAVFPQKASDGSHEFAVAWGDELRMVITQTWEVSLALLDQRGIPQARPLLRLLSCFGTAPIPYALLLDVSTLAGSSLFPGLTPQRLWQALTALSGLSLLTLARNPESAAEITDTVQLHPLVRATNRTHPDITAHLDPYLALITQLLLHAIEPLDTAGPGNWPRWQTLAPHCLTPLDLLPAETDLPVDVTKCIAWPATYAAYYLRAAGQYTQAEATLRAVLAAQTRRLGADHADTLATRNDFALVLHDLGQLDQAETEYQAVHTARVHMLGADHLQTLATQHNLALVQHDRGRLDQAEIEYRAVLNAYTRRLGADHPHTLTTRHNLARVLHDRGQLDQAETEYRAVLTARRLGADHPDTLTTRHELARILHDRGQLDQAETKYQAVLTARIRWLGADHPDTLTTRHELARILHDRGQLDQAETKYQAVLTARIRWLGADHPDTLTTRRALDRVLHDREQLSQ